MDASAKRRHISCVDSLLVLLQNRKGTRAARRRASARAAPGVGEDPVSNVPEMSTRSAESAGEPLSEADIDALAVVTG